MNELFDPENPGGPQHIVRVGNGLLHTPIEYDDEQLDVDPAFRYVIRPESAPNADSPDP